MNWILFLSQTTTLPLWEKRISIEFLLLCSIYLWSFLLLLFWNTLTISHYCWCIHNSHRDIKKLRKKEKHHIQLWIWVYSGWGDSIFRCFGSALVGSTNDQFTQSKLSCEEEDLLDFRLTSLTSLTLSGADNISRVQVDWITQIVCHYFNLL